MPSAGCAMSRKQSSKSNKTLRFRRKVHEQQSSYELMQCQAPSAHALHATLREQRILFFWLLFHSSTIEFGGVHRLYEVDDESPAHGNRKIAQACLQGGVIEAVDADALRLKFSRSQGRLIVGSRTKTAKPNERSTALLFGHDLGQDLLQKKHFHRAMRHIHHKESRPTVDFGLLRHLVGD
ncbi:hypothetical protein AC579_3625 [Pseudocercospora musae]|uniref:Uncharacterized protein n=1 Tax=Pseudocercospora musae TaxID=113226 RepID=A0A139ISM5_9PEZI|nr:hypothetical protein AC579_3625 [Pseudocercospora musae]